MSFWTRWFGGKQRDGKEAPADDEPLVAPAGERAGGLRDGKKHGLWVETDCGRLVERTYTDGVIHGPVRVWHDGSLYWQGEFADGAEHGIGRIFEADGRLALEITYRAGKFHGRYRALAADGSTSCEREYRDDKIYEGPYEIAGSDGKLILRGTYVAGGRVGAYEEYRWDGRVKERGPYVDGKKHGAFELGDDDGSTWRGRFEMDERVGPWELLRKQGGSARGDYPHGTWTVTAADGRSVTVEPPGAEAIARWIELAERWLAGRHDLGVGAWPVAERPLASAWIDARVAESPRKQRRGTGSANEIRDRDAMATAEPGDLVLPERVDSTRPKDDDSYMKVWCPDRKLRAVAIATVELPARIIVGSPILDPRDVIAGHAGRYDVLGIEIPDVRLWLPAMVMRRTGVAIARWQFWDTAEDSDMIVVAAGADFTSIEFAKPREGAFGALEWIRPGRTTDGQASVWVTNPSGNGIRAYRGLAADKSLAALVFQLY